MAGTLRRGAAVGSHGARVVSRRVRGSARRTARRDRRHRRRRPIHRPLKTRLRRWNEPAARSIASSACSASRARASPTPRIRRSSASGSRSCLQRLTPSSSIKDCSRASAPSTSRCPLPICEPDQVRVVTRIYEHFVRGGAKLNAADKQRLSDINQQLAARFAEFRAKVLADENTSTVVRRRRGDRQHAVERRSVSDALPAARSPRDRLEEIQEPRRQRRRKRHEGDHYGYRAAARRARQAARISEPRALAHDGYDGGRSGKRRSVSC